MAWFLRAQHAGWLLATVLLLPGVAAHAHPRYFPEDRLTNGEVGSYSNRLRSLHEPSLWEHRHDEYMDVYRWLWLRSFHPALSITIGRFEGDWWLQVKELGREDQKQGDRIVLERKRWLIGAEWGHFHELLDAASFWTLPTHEHRGLAMLDGAEWILEGVDEGDYHVVVRQSPDADDKDPSRRRFREACLYLLQISGLKLEEDEIY